MKKYVPYFAVFALGLLVAYFLFKPKKTTAEDSGSQLISYEIKKLNKMIVLEEYYTYQQSFEGNVLPKSLLESFDVLKHFDHKKIVVLAKGTSQVSYDMKQINIEVDEYNKKLIIKELPSPKFDLFTDVEYLNLDTGVINSVDAKELNTYKDYVSKKIKDQVDEPALEKKAHQQLVENLSDLFVLAKVLDWEIVDKTQIAPEIESYLQKL